MISMYPGSFDPLTFGHLDVIKRVSKFSDKLVVAVLNNRNKNPLFTLDERIHHLKTATKDMENLEIVSFSGLLVDLAMQYNADTIIKGIRSTIDFEYELQMAFANIEMTKEKEIETLLIPTRMEYAYLSSSIVKEIAYFGGNINNMVPAFIKEEIINKSINRPTIKCQDAKVKKRAKK